ncbi:MAG: HAMP domain-containing sensor histidine kinase [Clostridia bacterium]
MKKNEVVRLASQIEEEYKDGKSSETIDSVAYKNACSIFIFRMDGDLIYSSSATNQTGDSNIAQLPSRPISIDTSGIVEKINQSPNKKISYTLNVARFKTELYVYGKVIPDTNECLVMVTSIDPIDATTSVLKSQLVYVTIIALLISSIISIFISRRLSRPIVNITETAKKLATGCYDIEFEKAGYAEADNLADTLNFVTKELNETDKVRKELIANVSHDLRTPLTMIKAYSEMIRDLSGDDKEKREEHIQVIIDETDRLSRLVSDMMDLSKIESGFSKLSKTRFNIREVAENILNGFKILDKNEKSEFKAVGPKEIFVMADKTKIEQVIYNLMVNAFNHTEGDRKIEVKITTSGKRVKVQIKDNGVGISKEDLPHIWTRYYKVDKTFKRSSTGTGLGLSIVKNILDKHNSNYGVESELEKGSVFWFDLEKS